MEFGRGDNACALSPRCFRTRRKSSGKASRAGGGSSSLEKADGFAGRQAIFTGSDTVQMLLYNAMKINILYVGSAPAGCRGGVRFPQIEVCTRKVLHIICLSIGRKGRFVRPAELQNGLYKMIFTLKLLR